jgi:hypothetical protein
MKFLVSWLSAKKLIKVGANAQTRYRCSGNVIIWPITARALINKNKSWWASAKPMVRTLVASVPTTCFANRVDARYLSSDSFLVQFNNTHQHVISWLQLQAKSWLVFNKLSLHSCTKILLYRGNRLPNLIIISLPNQRVWYRSGLCHRTTEQVTV